jgi:hypothetical protein
MVLRGGAGRPAPTGILPAAGRADAHQNMRPTDHRALYHLTPFEAPPPQDARRRALEPPRGAVLVPIENEA